MIKTIKEYRAVEDFIYKELETCNLYELIKKCNFVQATFYRHVKKRKLTSAEILKIAEQFEKNKKKNKYDCVRVKGVKASKALEIF